MGKYQLDSAENKEFLKGLRDELLAFGHRFPSPGGGSYYLGKDDGSHILFVNASYDSNDRIGELMHDFRCADPDELISPVIAERFTYLKKDEKGRESMCQMMEEMRNEAALQAALEKSRSIALKMIEKGTYPLEEISDITGLPVEEVKLIAANKSA